jgi:hypothetical protein
VDALHAELLAFVLVAYNLLNAGTQMFYQSFVEFH